MILFWIVLTALIVYAAGYLISEYRRNVENQQREARRMERRYDDLPALTNGRRPRDGWGKR